MSASPSVGWSVAERARYERNQKFVAALRELVRDRERGTLAALRRGLGKAPEEAGEMFPFVWKNMPDGTPEGDVPSYFLVASLFAWHPRSWEAREQRRERTNFGASFAQLARKRESGSIEGRFVALLNAHPDDLRDHLQHAVGLLKAEEIPVDWVQLLGDIQQWDSERRRVQRRWARAYWGYTPGAAEESEQGTGSPEAAEQDTEEESE